MSALDYLGNVKAPTRDIAAEVAAAFDLPDYPAPYNGPVMWGYNSDGAEHGTGRAIDFMIRNSPSVGDAIAEHLWANRERYGLIHLIWKQRIRGTRVSPGVWRHMEDRGSPTNNHMDHIHALFDGRAISRDGGAQSVPFEPPKQQPEPQERYWTPTAKGYTTADVQRIVDVTVDNLYGPATRAAVRDLQKKLGVTADGYFGPTTAAAFEKSQNKGSGKKAPKFPLPRGHWYGPESSDKRNHSGYYKRDRDGIRTWQKRMKERGWTIGVDGRFGPQSESVAESFQREKGLSVDGCVGNDTWAASWTEPVT